ncbi:MAG: sulfatase [Candidatus Saelkia tenebricola]|nr:sulfatase [Candidatus Saelkia tenebricola]
MKKIIIIISVFFACLVFISGIFLVRHHHRLNVVLITIDALRWDHLGFMGYGKDTSPALDNISKNSFLFTHVITQANFTPPSICSLLTSTYPGKHKVFDFGYEISKDVVSIAEILKKKGYFTALISEHAAFDIIKGLDKRFDLFEISGVEKSEFKEKIKGFLNINKKPFFLYLHLMSPHADFKFLPVGYQRLFSPEDYFSQTINTLKSQGNKILPNVLEPGINDISYYLARYDSAIKYADSQIAYLLNMLDGKKLTDKTLIIISSDHGELLGEHGYYFHHRTPGMYEQEIKVGCLIYHRNHIEGFNTIGQQVESIDIMPTILDYLKIPKNRDMQGVSLYPLIKGDNNYEKKYAFSFSFSRGSVNHVVRTDKHKLLLQHGGVLSLFDLSLEESAQNDIYTTESVIGKELNLVLDDYIKENFSFRLEEHIQLSEKEKMRLRSLGYTY